MTAEYKPGAASFMKVTGAPVLLVFAEVTDAPVLPLRQPFDGQLGRQSGRYRRLAGQVRGQVGPGGDAELLEGVPEVGLDGGLGDEQVLGDLPVGQAVGGEAGDPPFGAGERVRAREGGAPGPGAGRKELPPGPLGQRRGTGALRQIQGAAERDTGVGAPS